MTMKLEILVPDGVVLDTPINGLRAADTSGLFGLWPNHEDFATLLVPCVLSYRDEKDCEHYAAVDGGVLVLRSQTRGANPGNGCRTAGTAAHPGDNEATRLAGRRSPAAGRPYLGCFSGRAVGKTHAGE